MIECRCEHCHGTFMIPDSMIGTGDNCPLCGRRTELLINVGEPEGDRRKKEALTAAATAGRRLKRVVVVVLVIFGGAIIGMIVLARRSPVELSHEARDRRIAGDKTAADDMLRIDILWQLSQTPRLGRRELDRAAELMQILEDRYGPLGLSIDGAGRICGMEAQPRDRSRDDLLTGGQKGEEKLRRELDRVTAAAFARRRQALR